jgi:hypothetical protein
MRVAGPPMLRPSDIDAVVRAAARQRTSPRPIMLPAIGSARRPTASGAAAQPAMRRIESLPSDPTASGTGINPWWRYQEQAVPGGGRVLVNVGTGNLLFQDDDMTVPHKGIGIAFLRTYNSQTPSTVNGYFVTWQSLFGNGWTNTFDAHVIASSPTAKSVYDIDGARYDYLAMGDGTGRNYSLTPGQHATLQADSVCGNLWTKKSGTIYYFYVNNPGSACPSLGTIGGYAGRLYQIIDRNRNIHLTLTYAWDNGNASVNGKINTIYVQSESGLTATLNFADVNGRRLLQQIIFPDGVTTVSYEYDASGNLVTVSHPPNNASGVRPTEMYGYQSIGSDSVLSWVASPRFNAGCTSTCGSDGGYLSFGITGSNAVASTIAYIAHVAVVNPTIPDGTNSGPIQGTGYSTSATQYLTEYYTTGVTMPTFRDTDGHR